MVDVVAALVLAVLLGAAIAYIVRQKRAGVKCIGCPAGQSCAERAKVEQGLGACSCGAVNQMLANMEKSID